MATALIETERTMIRVPDIADAAILHTFIVENREHLSKWEPLRDEEYYTLASCRRLITNQRRDYKQGTALPLIALLKGEERIVARCNFSNIVRGAFSACHLGYSVDREHEGKGFMFEVADASIRYVFDALRLHRIMANYIPRNGRSEQLLQRLGFEWEGYARSYLMIAGEWEGHVLTSRINPEL